MIEKPATHMIAIGGSAGAYELIVELLESLPAHFSVAIVVVLHRNSKYETKIESSLSQRLNKKVISVKDKMTVLPDNIYFAPPGYHLLIEPHFSFSLDISEPVQFSRPSIDVFFESMADIYQDKGTAFLLSGANTDGTYGLKRLLEMQATCYIQDPKDAKIDTMPRSGMTVSKKIKTLNNAEIIDFFSQLI
ncbi:chemotaxis protein CheB [Sphingobacterium humi]|uniref:protein-glutamate methylesterase n=1 Tax=Sphingobacterium humi TaxID=1796905 RepID=A0A6N8L0M1_9SPHI|nr:chemotaxis protein CheB [Sphingobacterium humi]MVZ63295.1 chemotaxis protein CheB [Sphingobacterium humi]